MHTLSKTVSSKRGDKVEKSVNLKKNRIALGNEVIKVRKHRVCVVYETKEKKNCEKNLCNTQRVFYKIQCLLNKKKDDLLYRYLFNSFNHLIQ